MSVVIAWCLGAFSGFVFPLGAAVVVLQHKGRLDKVVDAIRGK